MDKRKGVLLFGKTVCILGILAMSDVLYRIIYNMSNNIIRFGVCIMLLKYMIIIANRILDIKTFNVKKVDVSGIKMILRKIIVVILYDALCIGISATLLYFIKNEKIKFGMCSIMLLISQICFKRMKSRHLLKENQ